MARPKGSKNDVVEVDEVKEEVMAGEAKPVEEEEIEIVPVKNLVCPSDKTTKFQYVTYVKPVLIKDPNGGEELIAVDTEVEDGYVCVTCHHLYELDDLEPQDVIRFA